MDTQNVPTIGVGVKAETSNRPNDTICKKVKAYMDTHQLAFSLIKEFGSYGGGAIMPFYPPVAGILIVFSEMIKTIQTRNDLYEKREKFKKRRFIINPLHEGVKRVLNEIYRYHEDNLMKEKLDTNFSLFDSEVIRKTEKNFKSSVLFNLALICITLVAVFRVSSSILTYNNKLDTDTEMQLNGLGVAVYLIGLVGQIYNLRLNEKLKLTIKKSDNWEIMLMSIKTNFDKYYKYLYEDTQNDKANKTVIFTNLSRNTISNVLESDNPEEKLNVLDTLSKTLASFPSNSFSVM